MMKMNKRILLFLLPLLLLGNLAGVHAAFNVHPVIIAETVQPGQMKVTQIQVQNTDANETHQYVLSVTGAVSDYIVLEDNDFELPGQTAKTLKVYLIVPEDANEGTYTGYITVDEADTNASSKQVYVEITVDPWVFSTTRWVQCPSTLYVDSYKFNVSLTDDENGVKINNETLYRDDEKVFHDKIRIKVLDINRDNDQVYLKIDTKMRNPAILVQQQTKEERENVEFPSWDVESSVELYPSQITKKIQQGIKSSSLILYLYNGLPTSIKIERVDISGDVFEFEDGTSEPISGYKLTTQTNILEPGDQIPIVIKLSTQKIEPGRYTATVTVSYRVGSKLRYKTAILDVVVFKSQSQAVSEVSVELPDEIRKDERFVIRVRGVTSSYNIKVKFSNESCVEGSGELLGNVYEYEGKLTCDLDKLTVTVDVRKDNNLIKSISKEYVIKKEETTTTVKQMFIKIDPLTPQPGDIVRVYVVDDKGNVLSGASIKVNGLPMTSFIAEPKKTYNIEATLEGYRKATRTVVVPGKKFKVTITPENPKVGDNITIEVRDAKTNQLVSATIKVNGKAINGNTYHIDKEGTYTITVEANEYDTFTKVIYVKKPLVINISKTKIEKGDYIFAEANKKVFWEVYYVDPKTNESVQVYVSPQPEQTLSYKATKTGTYKVKVGTKEYYVTVTKAKIKLSFTTILWILLGFIVLLIIIKIIRKIRRRRKKSKSSKKTAETKPMFSHTLPEGFPAEKLTSEESKKVEDIEKGE